MNKLLRAAISAAILLTSVSAAAHEYWMLATPFAVPLNGTTIMSLHVGEYFSGYLVGITNTHVANLHHYAAGIDEDLNGRITGEPVGELPVRMTAAGTHMLAMESFTSQITLPAEKFHAYLHDEGLDAIVKMREAAGTAATPSRERFRRNVKTLVRVGGKSDNTWSLHAKLRLELVPLVDPTVQPPGYRLGFQMLFDGEPLAGALVKAWHQLDGQTVMIRAKSDESGKLTFTLPYSGTWMLSFVHMIPATDSADVDWDSYWGNLTFEVPSKKR